MSKTFKFIIVLIFTSYHFCFVFCQFYSEPKFIYRLRKSGIRPRSFKSYWPRKAFETKDRKALDISEIYSDKFLKQIESSLQPKFPGQWQAAVETRPRKKDKFPETAQKTRHEKESYVDISSSEELSSNFSEELTKKLKHPQKEIQQLKEAIRKEKQKKEDRKKNEGKEALPIEILETSEQSKSKELKSEQIQRNTPKPKVKETPKPKVKETPKPKVKEYHYPISIQTAVDQKNNLLREGHHHHSQLVSRQDNHENHCVKKCYTPKCEVECLGRQGSAACSANKCKATTRGSDSAAVCKGDKCQGECLKDDCIAACEGDACSVTCEGNICHAVAEGRRTKSKCEGDNCVAYGKGTETRPKCKGSVCQTWCVGDACVAKCVGFNCEAMCSGLNCKALCVGRNCTQFHNPGKPGPHRPWVLDTKKEDAKSQEISISSESGDLSDLPSKPNIDDDDVVDDGYYGNKQHVKNTINGKDEDDVQNNIPYSVNKPVDNKGDGGVTIDYTMAVQLSQRLGEFLKKKISELKALSLLNYVPGYF